MKKKVILLSMVLIGALVLSPVDTEARGRNNANVRSGNSRPAASAPSQSHNNRPGGNNNRPNPGNNNRPGGSNHNPGASTRPGGGNNNRPNPGNNNRPNPGNNNRPNPGNNNRPGGGNHNPGPSQRPNTPPPMSGRPGSPSPGHHPGGPTPHPGGPGPRPNGPRPGMVPPRPHTPPSFHYYRPTPPPSWRPVGHLPNFGTILGVTLGTVLANSLTTLATGGYNVAGYTGNEVYLTNVNLYNLVWPNVTMYYNNGYLNGSLFSSASAVYDPSRYNYVFNSLRSQYGAPVSVQQLNNGGISSTWWGYNNNYITLSYYPEYLATGGLRYFTTVTLGN